MNRPSRSVSLWGCALECAFRREYGRCELSYGDVECAMCKWNVARYGCFSESDLALYMLQAEGEACQNAIEERSRRIRLFLLVLAIIACVMYYNHTIEEFNRKTREYVSTLVPPETTAAIPQPKQSDRMTIDTLRKVAQRLRSGIDVNSDGMTNCIDAAVLFYQYYPDKDRVCIELNVNPTTGMNHLFNCVYMGGNWIAIEPQARWYGNAPYRMQEHWGSVYDRSLNKDVTVDYLRYVKY